jgi:hypothetical protein
MHKSYTPVTTIRTLAVRSGPRVHGEEVLCSLD